MIEIKAADGTTNSHVVSPTIFPDGTSQVWKLPDWVHNIPVRIEWYYENESELIHLNQLVDLLTISLYCDVVSVFIPYLPYARQDKSITNETTFAKYTFATMLPGSVSNPIEFFTLDAHSGSYSGMFPKMITNLSPKQYIERAVKYSTTLSNKLYLVFPDQGAANRYSHMFPDHDYLVVEKVRDQLTGVITGLKFSEDDLASMEAVSSIHFYSTSPSFLIVDDICDGGMTFIKTAELIKNTFARTYSINLYVTHGIFSKGMEVLHNAGIKDIYTTQSLLYFRENNNLGSFGFKIENTD